MLGTLFRSGDTCARKELKWDLRDKSVFPAALHGRRLQGGGGPLAVAKEWGRAFRVTALPGPIHGDPELQHWRVPQMDKLGSGPLGWPEEKRQFRVNGWLAWNSFPPLHGPALSERQTPPTGEKSSQKGAFPRALQTVHEGRDSLVRRRLGVAIKLRSWRPHWALCTGAQPQPPRGGPRNWN